MHVHNSGFVLVLFKMRKFDNICQIFIIVVFYICNNLNFDNLEIKLT